MLFNMNALLMAPLLQKLEGCELAEKAINKQGQMLTSISKVLNCSRPDKFKVAYDQRQIDIANGATDLPPLKQI